MNHRTTLAFLAVTWILAVPLAHASPPGPVELLSTPDLWASQPIEVVGPTEFIGDSDPDPDSEVPWILRTHLDLSDRAGLDLGTDQYLMEGGPHGTEAILLQYQDPDGQWQILACLTDEPLVEPPFVSLYSTPVYVWACGYAQDHDALVTAMHFGTPDEVAALVLDAAAGSEARSDPDLSCHDDANGYAEDVTFGDVMNGWRSCVQMELAETLDAFTDEPLEVVGIGAGTAVILASDESASVRAGVARVARRAVGRVARAGALATVWVSLYLDHQDVVEGGECGACGEGAFADWAVYLDTSDPYGELRCVSPDLQARIDAGLSSQYSADCPLEPWEDCFIYDSVNDTYVETTSPFVNDHNCTRCWELPADHPSRCECWELPEDHPDACDVPLPPEEDDEEITEGEGGGGEGGGGGFGEGGDENGACDGPTDEFGPGDEACADCEGYPDVSCGWADGELCWCISSTAP